jgi:hypothetical protein
MAKRRDTREDSSISDVAKQQRSAGTKGGPPATERAHAGEPAGQRVREGRQHVPGDRDPFSRPEQNGRAMLGRQRRALPAFPLSCRP